MRELVIGRSLGSKRNPDRQFKAGVYSKLSPYEQSRVPNSREKVKRERAPDRRAKSGVYSKVRLVERR